MGGVRGGEATGGGRLTGDRKMEPFAVRVDELHTRLGEIRPGDRVPDDLCAAWRGLWEEGVAPELFAELDLHTLYGLVFMGMQCHDFDKRFAEIANLCETCLSHPKIEGV